MIKHFLSSVFSLLSMLQLGVLIILFPLEAIGMSSDVFPGFLAAQLILCGISASAINAVLL